MSVYVSVSVYMYVNVYVSVSVCGCVYVCECVRVCVLVGEVQGRVQEASYGRIYFVFQDFF